MDIPQPTREFLESLLIESGTLPDSEDLKESMLEDLFSRLNNKLVLALAEHLNEEQMQKYGEISLENPAEGNQYLQSVLPNAPEVFVRAMAEFREVFLSA